MLIGLIADAIPSTISMLNTFEPIALPSAISTSFFLAATIEVTSSGSDVPIETIVSPISVWIFAGTRKKIGRIEGFSMVVLYLIYAVYIIIR